MSKTVDECVAELDQKYHNWDIWRCGPVGGKPAEWLVRLHLDRGMENLESLTSPSIEDALRKAADFNPLPRVPRQPAVFDRSEFDVKKSGNKWQILHRGSMLSGNIKTRREAEALVERLMKRSIEQERSWAERYSEIVNDGTEGVTFRWAN